jgi:hypothetical protein
MKCQGAVRAGTAGGEPKKLEFRVDMTTKMNSHFAPARSAILVADPLDLDVVGEA